MTHANTGHAILIDLKLTIYSTSIDLVRELLNLLAKIYTNKMTYSDWNDRFILELAICLDTYIRTNASPEAKMKAFFFIFKDLALGNYDSNINVSDIAISFDQICYLTKMRWIKSDKNQNEMNKTRINVE